MAGAQYTFRIASEGFQEFRRQVEDAANSNERLAAAWQRLQAASPQLATATLRSQQALTETVARTQQATVATERLAQAQQTAGTGMRSFGNVMGQAGYQVQDFVVQVSAGQSALVALGQQGSQMLGIFGTGGAVAGAILTIGVLAAQLAGAADSGKALSDVLKGQQEQYRDATEAATRYREGLAEEANRVRELTNLYASYSAQLREAEQRRLQSEADRLETQRNALSGQATFDAQGLGTLAANAARTRVFNRETGQMQAQGVPSQITEGLAALMEFRARGEVTAETLADLAAKLRDAASVASGPVATAFQGVVSRIDTLLPQFRELDRATQQNRSQMEAISTANEAAARSFNNTTRAIGEVRAALAGLRSLTLGGSDQLQGDADRAQARAEAIARAGRGGAEEASQVFDAAEERLRRVQRAREDDIKSIMEHQRVSREEASALADEAPRAEARWENATRLMNAETRARQLLSEARKRSQESDPLSERDPETGQSMRVMNLLERLQNQQDTKNEREQSRANEQREREERQVRERREREEASVTDNITRYAGDRFADLLGRNGRTWRDFLKGLETTALQTFGRIAAEAIIRPIVQPIVSGLFGGGGGGGGVGSLLSMVLTGGRSVAASNLTGGTGGASSAAMTYAQATSILGGGSANAGGAAAGSGGILGDFGGSYTNILGSARSIYSSLSGNGMSNTGIGFVDNALNYQVFGSGYGGAIGAGYAAEVAAAAPGSFDALASGALSQGGGGVGMTVGQGLGAAGSLFSAYQGFERGGVGGYIQGVGGVVGGGMQIASMLGLGASLGPWGLAIAAVAAILGNLFGGKKSWKGGYVGVGVNSSTGQLDILSTISKGVDLSKEIAETQREIDQLNGEISKRGLYIQPEAARVTSPTQFQQKEGELYGFIAAAGEAKTTTDWKKVDIAIANNLKAHNQDKDVQRAIDISFGGGLEGALWNVDFVLQQYKPAMESLSNQGGRFAQALKELSERFKPIVERAGSMGLAVGELQDAWDRARIAIEKERDITREQLTGGLDIRSMRLTGRGGEADRLAFDINAKGEALRLEAALMDVGMSQKEIAAQLAKLGQVQALERAAIGGGGTGGSAQQLLENLAFGGGSALSPETQYFAAMQSFNAARQGLGAGGMTEYLRVVQSVAPVLKNYLGVSDRYASFIATVAGDVSGAAPGSDAANLAAILQAQASSSDTLASLGTQQLETLQGIRGELQRLATKLDAVVARAAMAA